MCRRALLGLALVAVTASAAGQSELHSESEPGTFGRIFSLPAFAAPSPEITAALLELGKRGGPMDAHDDANLLTFAGVADKR